PHVRVFGANAEPESGFFAFDSLDRAGVGVSSTSVSSINTPAILGSTVTNNGFTVRLFDKSGVMFNEILLSKLLFSTGANVAIW
ncbi:TPA: hypothetical protein DCZ32_01265, partial [Candidatus Uhrbacteria bacterium]|nr:hypothetical protein [Candidatus Uhrbacteria bacterium]